MAVVNDPVQREPLPTSGVSGAQLERVQLADGSTLVLKHERPARDWLAQATGDDGRIVRLWDADVFARLPADLDSAMVGVERTAGGWTVVMRDVAAALLPADSMVSRQQARLLLAAAARLHRQFRGVDLPDDLINLQQRYQFLSPRIARGLAGTYEIPRLVLAGWERFADVVPGDVASAVARILEDLSGFVEVLGRYPSTLVHGDLKLSNLGMEGERVVLIDWGALTGPGPAAADYAHFLAINSARLEGWPDEVLADVRVVQGGDYDDGEMKLALLGALLHLGWEKALGATSDDAAVRERERAGLAWWVARAREALDEWSPA